MKVTIDLNSAGLKMLEDVRKAFGCKDLSGAIEILILLYAPTQRDLRKFEEKMREHKRDDIQNV